ncbi:MAG: type II and III secretion system protein, partial [Acidobacteria bacterium]|nr:type II and III secretion system protein [Acidobacteriota bacterium]
MHARTVGALLSLPPQTLILSVAYSLSRDELEQRIRGGVDPLGAPGWAGMARRTAGRLVSEPVYERLWFLIVRLADGGGRQVVDRIRAAASEVGSVFGVPSPPPARSRVAVAISEAEVLAEQLSQHLRLRPLDAYQVRWLYQRAVLRGLAEPALPDEGSGTDRPSVVRLDRDTVYFEGGRRTDADRPSHWRYLTVEHPDHGTGYQTFTCLAEIPAAWTFPYGSGEWLFHLDDQLPFPVDWAVRIETVDNQTARLQVGDQVPIATQSAVSVADPNSPIVNQIQFLDTGVILSVTPRVNAGGMVIMEIEQQVSDVVATTTSGIDSPTIRQRQISSTVAVQSGQTIALGGLIRE